MIVKAPIDRAVIAPSLFAEASFLLHLPPVSTEASPAPALVRAPPAAPIAGNVRALGGLLPFVRPYWGRIALAGLFLVLAAVSTLVFPIALKSLIDQGFVATDPGARVMALREHFFALFAVGVALGVFSAARFYLVSWLGERHRRPAQRRLRARRPPEPAFFERRRPARSSSRPTTDMTLVQTVVGSSLSMGLRNTVMGIGAMAMLIVTNPVVMTQVFAILVLVVLPLALFSGRVRAGLLAREPDRSPTRARSPPRC
jgi:ATP-binding cassette subfamily B protein